MDLNVIPECYIDTKLIKVLCPPTIRYNHQKGCSNVMKLMQTKLKNDFALGIINEDKRVMLYAEEFELLSEVEGLIKLLKHPKRNHFIIYISPAMEKWLIEVSRREQLDLESFGLPSDVKALKGSGSSITATLTFWIEHLKANPYNADLELLRR
jgi:hypothetical protein